MNLIVDIGNTRSKFFLFDSKDKIIEKSVFMNQDEKKIEDYLKSIAFKKMIVSTTKKLPQFFSNYTFLELNNETPIPIKINYATPKTLGSDRIALAVGAFTRFPNKNCLIIGTGTCITTNFIDEKATYQGGSIAPGLTLRLQSLHTFTDMLPLIEHKKDEKEFDLIGKSTKDSIKSGVFNGAFAEIDGIIYRYMQNYKDLTVILTGGDQEIFAKNLKSIIFANSNIQALGLNRILNYNV
ncbi:MAG: type III pantothenate kinase [Chitinophagales bacterium]